MKREEKNQLTRRKVLESALAEFAEKGYDAASMNNLCMAGGVSKGIVYHYFTDKDELYLACISECFTMLRQATGAIRLDEASGIAEGLAAYFEITR
jgi:AcrR family transcriptional regulator